MSKPIKKEDLFSEELLEMFETAKMLEALGEDGLKLIANLIKARQLVNDLEAYYISKLDGDCFEQPKASDEFRKRYISGIDLSSIAVNFTGAMDYWIEHHK